MGNSDVFSCEAIAELRSKIGIPLRRELQYNEEATRDTIIHFAYGYGDTNPLFCNVEYGRQTRYGTIIAPPTFIFSCLSHISSAHMGLRGAHALYLSDDIEWFNVICLGDHITSEDFVYSLEKAAGSFSKRVFDQYGATIFKNQRGEIVARKLMRCRRFERLSSEKRDKYSNLKKYKYSTEEIKAIQADYDKEELRGANPRYWENVQPGEKLPHVIKGPLTVTDIIVYKMGQGWSPFSRAHGIRLAYKRRHPTTAVYDSLGIPDAPERVHWDDELAQTVGVPAAFDFGHQRITWLAHVLTNWMGDEGFLRRLYVEVRVPNIISNTTWCRGKVTKKYVKDGEHLVDCELWAENQRQQTTAQARATVCLPSKVNGPVSLPLKMEPWNKP